MTDVRVAPDFVRKYLAANGSVIEWFRREADDPRPPVPGTSLHMRTDFARIIVRRLGMTLTELMIVIAMLAILAAIVVPMFGTTSDMARTEAMASNAVQVRSMIIQHASTKDVPLSPSGFPNNVQGTWFKMGHLPEHSWTGHPLQIETVSAAANITYPATKTFDPRVAGALNAWYNATNGRFWVRVPVQSSAAATLQLFNDVNKCNAKTLAQTTG